MYLNLPGGVSLYTELYPASPSYTSPSTPPSPASPLLPPLNNPPLSPSHPTLLLISPSWLDLTFLGPFLTNQELRRGYNLVCLDLRAHGRTKAEVQPGYDFFVAAADVAFAMEALQLPPSHIFAAGAPACQTALKLSLLFPSLVLSLSLIGLGSLFSLPKNREAFAELDAAWKGPEDEDDFYDALDALTQFFLHDWGKDGADPLRDEVAGAMCRRYSPYYARRTHEISRPNHRHPGLAEADLGAITQPVLIVHSEDELVFPIDGIVLVRNALINAKELDFHPITNAPHLLAITHTSLVLSLLTSFLSRHPTFSPQVVPLDLSFALRTSANLGGVIDSKMLCRNPRNPISFSHVSMEELEIAKKTLEEARVMELSFALNIPREKELWEMDGVQTRSRWKFSRRNLDAPRPNSVRQSMLDGVSVTFDQQSTTSEVGEGERL